MFIYSKRELYTLNLQFYKEGGQLEKEQRCVDLAMVTTLALVCGVRAVNTMHAHTQCSAPQKRQEEEEVQDHEISDMQAGHYISLLGSYE